ncbi:SEC-C metal-binding domain-containing protein [Bacillus dakarensis]|uniref:SEC-C metal-binding domain-containing protein n=1 Tax=Robertmurraya dakarensis TaxID=1926278 RepID=UPI00137A92A3|nr:SEC-C metal-binding domain-containing protein [Bacillus dakarensis]
MNTTKTKKPSRSGVITVQTGSKGKNLDKKDQRIWSKITVPISMNEALSSLNKSDLDQIRRHLKIKNASSLKKAELITLLEKEIPELLQDMLSMFDMGLYEMIKEIVNQDGYITAPDLTDNQIDLLRATGFIFTGSFKDERVIAIPQEIVHILKQLVRTEELNAVINRNTEWIQLTNGLLYYYGTLNTSDLLVLLDQYTGKQHSAVEYFSVLDQAISYYQNIKVDEHGYSHASVLNAAAVVKEQQMRGELNYYPFKKNQVLAAGAKDYVERTDHFVKLGSYLARAFECSKEDAEKIAKQCEFAARMGDGPNDVLRFLGRVMVFNSVEAVQGVMDQVVELMNHTRQWFLKGYTPNELSSQEKKLTWPLTSNQNPLHTNLTQKQRKVGRNEPCICGSGKKYKKCCGK